MDGTGDHHVEEDKPKLKRPNICSWSFVDPRPKMMMGCDYQREMVWRGRNSNRELGVKERILKGDED
jgi:hypothetical protein